MRCSRTSSAAVVATLRSTMDERTIPQRELRNNIAGVLRDAQAGATFTVTVRGRAVALLGPLERARIDVDRATIERILATPVDGDALTADLDEAEAKIDGPREEP